MKKQYEQQQSLWPMLREICQAYQECLQLLGFHQSAHSSSVQIASICQQCHCWTAAVWRMLVLFLCQFILKLVTLIEVKRATNKKVMSLFEEAESFFRVLSFYLRQLPNQAAICLKTKRRTVLAIVVAIEEVSFGIDSLGRCNSCCWHCSMKHLVFCRQ